MTNGHAPQHESANTPSPEPWLFPVGATLHYLMPTTRTCIAALVTARDERTRRYQILIFIPVGDRSPLLAAGMGKPDIMRDGGWMPVPNVVGEMPTVDAEGNAAMTLGCLHPLHL